MPNRITFLNCDEHTKQPQKQFRARQWFEALAAAFRSSDSGFAPLFAGLFEHSNNEQRAKMLTILIPSLTAAAQQALYHAGGLFGYFPSGPEVAVECMSDLSIEAVQLIAAEAERSDPSVVERVCEFYSQYPNITKYLPAETAAAVLAHLAGCVKQPGRPKVDRGPNNSHDTP